MSLFGGGDQLIQLGLAAFEGSNEDLEQRCWVGLRKEISQAVFGKGANLGVGFRLGLGPNDAKITIVLAPARCLLAGNRSREQAWLSFGGKEWDAAGFGQRASE